MRCIVSVLVVALLLIGCGGEENPIPTAFGGSGGSGAAGGTGGSGGTDSAGGSGGSGGVGGSGGTLPTRSVEENCIDYCAHQAECSQDTDEEACIDACIDAPPIAGERFNTCTTCLATATCDDPLACMPECAAGQAILTIIGSGYPAGARHAVLVTGGPGGASMSESVASGPSSAMRSTQGMPLNAEVVVESFVDVDGDGA